MEDRYYLVAAPFLMAFVIGGVCAFMGYPLWPAFLYFVVSLPLMAIIFSARNNYTLNQKNQILKKADFDHLLCLPPNYVRKMKRKRGNMQDNSGNGNSKVA